MDKLNYKRIVIPAAIIVIAIITAVNLVIFGYALFLGFQARGAPDPQLITTFAASYAPVITVVSSILLTFLACLWTSRKVSNQAVLHGLLVAVLGALLIILYGIIFSQAIWHDLWAGLGMILFGYLGARTGQYLSGSPSSSNDAESQD